jgi:iron donor protein CyaY
MDEKEYRLKVKDVYARLERSFEGVDPDVAEVETGLGTLAILSGRSKTILSTQPSVRQIWLAVAALGVAVHFDWDASRQAWIDDKGTGKELFAYLQETLRQLCPGLGEFRLG